MIGVISDIRFALSTMVRRPLRPALIVLTLGVAIGATAVIFSFVNVLVIQPLPMRDVDRVTLVYSVSPADGVDRGPVSPGQYLEWRQHARSFQELAAAVGEDYTRTDGGEPVRVRGRRVTANLFSAWGLRPLLGRTLGPGDDRSGAPPVAVLSHGYWSRELGSDPGVIGREMRLDGRAHTIVGVLGPDIEIGTLSLVDVWTPLPFEGSLDQGRPMLQVTGLLAPGVTPERATSELRTIRGDGATEGDRFARVLPFTEAMAFPETWLTLSLLALVVGLLLVMACANAASLVMAGAVERRPNISVRLALGAGGARIVRLYLVEGLLLGLGAGALGLAIAGGALHVIKELAYQPGIERVTMDWMVLVFALTISAVTPILFALPSAVRSARIPPGPAIRAGPSGDSRTARIRSALVVVQVGLATVLLTLSLFAARSAVELRTVDPGFDAERLLILRVDLPESDYPEEQQLVDLYGDLAMRLATIPGATAAGLASRLPVFDRADQTRVALMTPTGGRSGALRSADSLRASRFMVTPDYFSAMGIPILRGRGMPEISGAGHPPVAIVNAELLRRLELRSGDVIGTRVSIAGLAGEVEVVGVAGDVRTAITNDAITPQVYLPLTRHPERNIAVIVRSSGDAAALASAARATIRTTDPALAPFGVITGREALIRARGTQGVATGMFVAAAAVALLLAMGGLYGIVAFTVSRRTRDVAIRTALGASPSELLRLLARPSIRRVLLGLAAGLAVAYPVSQQMNRVVYGVDTSAPGTYVIAALAMAVSGLMATYLPARRVTRVEVAEALRAE